MEYRIRAHHGMCFAFFQGKGYSGAFTENMWKMKERLQQNPEVVLLQETDDVCAKCPNNQNGRCISTAEKEVPEGVPSPEKAAGYDGAEPVMSENGYLNPDTTIAQIKEIKNLADSHGLEIPSVGVWALW